MQSEDVDAAIAEVLGGGMLRSSGGRCFHEYTFQNGAWKDTEVDEGTATELLWSEAQMRAWLAQEPELGREFLWCRNVARFGRAYFAKATDARAHLDAARKYGDPNGWLAIYEATLGWPEKKPDAAGLAAVTDALRRGKTFSAFLPLIDRQHSRENGVHGVAWVETLIEIAGGRVPGVNRARAEIAEMAKRPA